MNIRDAYSAKAIAINHKEVASNKIPYLGATLFPAKKKNGLDLKWIKTSKGLPVSLAPSNFDAVSTIRSRSGFKMEETEMAFFRESMIVKEADEQEIMRVQDTSDPYATEVLSRIYDDANTLIEAADVVPERMRMQLLAPLDGSPKISIQADGVTYAYNYDPDGIYKASNFLEISTSADKWDAVTTSDPMRDVSSAIDSVEELTGTRPAYMLVSKKTMGYLKQNTKIRNYILAQNTTATVIVTDARVKEIFQSELGISIIVYAKQYKDESGIAQRFYPDGFATLLPDGALGNTWYGTTPEERTLAGNGEADVSIVNTGVAIAVTTTNDPVHTKTTASEITLPSYERMDETFVIKCY
ncbi:major capsid protein [Clostridium sp. Marseille-P299]|uniref:major capsid protein n=1 Tax=Clostridium sp. Marseille-P299 TaxID=1805477 RepID=UPI000833627A|nr:major capsid protein [Clostridium sp. Marseille-P299]